MTPSTGCVEAVAARNSIATPCEKPLITRPVDGVIAVGGDIPPELDAAAVGRARRALVCRGTRDEWYTQAVFERDAARLEEARVAVTPLLFDGGHEWPDPVAEAASVFLRERWA